MSKIKILEANKNLLNNAQAVFNTILEMQTDAEKQIKEIKSIETKILDIEKVKNEKARAEREEQRLKEQREQALAAQKEQELKQAEETDQPQEKPVQQLSLIHI